MRRLLPLALLLAAPAVAGAQEDERLQRIFQRIEREIRESQARLREEIRQLVREELGGRPGATPAPAPAPAPVAKRATLGITAGDLDDAERKAAGIGGGVKIDEVRGPAEQAGLKPGDILLEIDGEAVSEERIGGVLAKRRPGESVKVLVLRGRNRETFTVVLGAR
jgi:S1-C subfamily serine protease